MRSLKVFAILGALALVPQLCASLLDAPRAAAQASAKPNGKRTQGLLYKVESTTATVYVLGSIHVADASLYPLDPRILSAFEQADTLVLETELTPTAKARG